MSETIAQAEPGAASFTDLGAVVYPACVPGGLADELPGLYGSLFATEPWFRIFDGAEATGACILEQPRHVLLFWRDGDTLEVLNKAFPMASADAVRACRALFRALPSARRIHLEILFPPGQLNLPKRVLSWADDMVIDLPPTTDEYYASLGKRTRKNVRNHQNRLRREHPDLVTTTGVTGGPAVTLFAQFLTWHLARARTKGTESGYVSKPRRAEETAALLRELGEAQVTTIDDRVATLEFVFYVGDHAALYAGSFDERFEHLDLGFLSTYWAIREAIGRGARHYHLLWGTDYYKSLLGARPVRATRLSVFRSQSARLHSLPEAREVGWRDTRRRAQSDYWRARHRVGAMILSLSPRDRHGPG
jgi:Acetyltransferase (GNAT) domain